MTNINKLLKQKEYKESDYKELHDLCLELGIPYMESFIDIMYGYPDEESKRLWEQPQRCHSWVRNTYNQIMACLGSLNLSDASPNWGTGFMNVKDTGGTIRNGSTPGFNNYDAEAEGSWLVAAVNINTMGILVGSDAAAESFEDYFLKSQLTANITHAAMSAPTRSQDGLNNKVSYSRKLTNATGGQVTFRECALVANMYVGAARKVMLSRDLITPALTLNNTGYLTPTYTIALTYPS